MAVPGLPAGFALDIVNVAAADFAFAGGHAGEFMAVALAGIGAEGQLVRVPAVPQKDGLAADAGKPVRVRRASLARSLHAALCLMNMQLRRAAFIFRRADFGAAAPFRTAPYIAAGGVGTDAGIFVCAAGRRAMQIFAVAVPGAGFACAAGFVCARPVI